MVIRGGERGRKPDLGSKVFGPNFFNDINDLAGHLGFFWGLVKKFNDFKRLQGHENQVVLGELNSGIYFR